MTIGLVGKKRGMTRVFTETGESIPVTVIEVAPNRVTQIKTLASDRYVAVQVTMGNKKSSRVNKPLAGHYAKAGTDAGELMREFLVEEQELSKIKLGDAFTVEHFKVGQMLDIQGVTRGKGFAGGVKRHNFRTQDATHGNSLSHRVIGSVGQCQTPGRVFKGKKMPGQLGNVNRSVLNQSVVQIDKDNNLILIRGAVPGAPSGYVILNPSVKAKQKEG